MTDFRWESEMTSPAIAANGSWWGSKQDPDFIAGEIVGPDAVADLAAIRFARGPVETRLREGIGPVTNALALQVLMFARDNPVTSAEVADQFRISRSAASNALSLGLEVGAIRKQPKHRYLTHPGWSSVAARVVAVELKLSNWQGAIRQAAAYSRWANSSWVILSREPNVQAVEAARSLGIGLALLSSEGTLHRIVRAVNTRSPGDEFAAAWASEQIYGRALSAGSFESAPVRSGDRTPGFEMDGLRVAG
ncbi:MAG: hypothetical protein JJE13_08890 [Thermoleophilia bacterium]|nr:hypothetical protein [Thermoleophilia bacterium]